MRWQRALTGEEMEELRRAATTAKGFAAGNAVLERFYAIALADQGTSLSEIAASPDGTLDPTQFTIPEPQWLAICGVLNERATAGRDDHNLPRTENPALMWMNTGPSAFPPDLETELSVRDRDDIHLGLTIEP